jgi:ribA/ribD-fused uncharacterized protein
MMYEKALLFDPEMKDEILASRSPQEIKALGRAIKNFQETKWKKNREKIVYRHNLAKFEQNLELQEKLMQTGSKILVEASPSDRIWGIGKHTLVPTEETGMTAQEARFTPASQWHGLNLLGNILTQVKEDLQSKEAAEIPTPVSTSTLEISESESESAEEST